MQRAVAGLPPTSAAGLQRARAARFEAVFGEHAGAVYAYARRRTTADVADDVVGETFLVAWRRLDELPTEARPWLIGVARNVLANQRRADGRRTALTDRLRHLNAVAASPDADTVAEAGVAAALATLPQAEREVLELLTWDDLSPTEVAVALDIPRATVYVRIHRARRRLARLLQEER